jgi:hypothetical protein
MFENIFIVGTGRSGTHFLCRSLLDFNNIEDYMSGEENHEIRIPLTHMAIRHMPLSNEIISYYKLQIKNATNEGKIFLDQLHTNLFHVEQLAKEFPNSLFLGTNRPVEQVVASMLNHGGVRRWFKFARKDTQTVFPNQFLGITRDELNTLDEVTLCTKRVLAHNKRTNELLKRIPNFRIVNFNELVSNKENTLKSLFKKEELPKLGYYNNKHKVHTDVLEKYKKQFSQTELQRIRNATI